MQGEGEDHGNDSARQRAGHASETLLLLVGQIDAGRAGPWGAGRGLTVALRLGESSADQLHDFVDLAQDLDSATAFFHPVVIFSPTLRRPRRHTPPVFAASDATVTGALGNSLAAAAPVAPRITGFGGIS